MLFQHLGSGTLGSTIVLTAASVFMSSVYPMVRQFQAFPSLLRRRAFHLEGFFLSRVVGVVPEPRRRRS
jgi:hypothetical protein